jgi:hypothetical protein
VSRTVPRPWRAWLVMAGCEARGKARGCPLRPGATGEGKTERVNVSEPLMMPRYGNSLRRVVMAGMTRSGPLRIGRRRPRTVLRSCGHRCSRGRGGTRPGRVSCVWNVETPSGPPHCWCGGRPTVRDAESRGGNRTPKKRMPVAERQQESGTIDRRSLQAGGFSYNWPDTGSGARPRKRADVWWVSP